MKKTGITLLTLTLIAAACGGGTGETTTTTTAPTTTTTAPTTTTTTTVPETTTTTQPPSPVLAVEGDVNEVVAQIQWLVTCGGFGNVIVDGEFDDITAEAVTAAQASLGFAPDAAPTEDFFIAATQLCFLDRELVIGAGPVRTFGFAALDEPEAYTFEGSAGLPMTVEILSGTSEALVTVFGPSGAILVPGEDGIITLEEEGTHRIEVSTAGDPVFFTIGMLFEFSGEAGDWIITTDGIAHQDTEFVIGQAAEPMIEEIYDILGHEPRGEYNEFDTGWEEPGQEGFRGVFIEGLAFLFIGPNAENPGRPMTFWRVRYVGESYDANGLPRPYGWVQTLSGITVGDTLDDLIETYGTQVRAGSNSEEHYYRYGAADGSEVCFYFGPDEPDDNDPVLEISTECRG